MTLQQVRERALGAARARVARELGEVLLGDDEAERNWSERFMVHYFQAFAFFVALDRYGTKRIALEVLNSPEIQAEIAAKVARALREIAA